MHFSLLYMTPESGHNSHYDDTISMMFGAGAGLVKLEDDVQTCGYEDVQVMWEMLHKTQSQLIQQHNHKRKQHPSWGVLVWSNHNQQASAQSTNHTKV